MLDAALAHVLHNAGLDESLVETAVAIGCDSDLVILSMLSWSNRTLNESGRTFDLLSSRILPSFEMHGKTPCSKMTTFSFFRPK